MKRLVQPEWLDSLPPDDPRARGSRRDLQRVNACMGNAQIMIAALEKTLAGRAPEKITELGTGDGHFLLSVAQGAAKRWPAIKATLLDLQSNVSAETLSAFKSLGWHPDMVIDDVFRWPASAGSDDIVLANLFLHHFENDRLAELLGLIASRAKIFIAIEPRRAAWPLFCSRLLWGIGCNDVTRHDAVISVRAGFSGTELSSLWPAPYQWRFFERRAGAFSHLFIAEKINAP